MLPPTLPLPLSVPDVLRTLSSALAAFIQRDKFWFVSFLHSLCSPTLRVSDFLSLFLSKRHFKFCALENLSPFAYHICHRPLDAHTQSSHVPVSVPVPVPLLLYASVCVCLCVSAWLTLLYSAELALSLCVGRMCASHLEIS